MDPDRMRARSVPEEEQRSATRAIRASQTGSSSSPVSRYTNSNCSLHYKFTLIVLRHRAENAMKENLSMPNPRHLRVFDVVARIQSVSRASAAVHLSQPAISQAIANLEEYFGVRLLERHQMGSMP